MVSSTPINMTIPNPVFTGLWGALLSKSGSDRMDSTDDADDVTIWPAYAWGVFRLVAVVYG